MDGKGPGVAKKKGEPAMVETIRAAIRDSGLTPVELGQAAGVNPAGLYRFVNGERTLTLPVAARVLEALGYDLVQQRRPVQPPPRRPRGRPRKAEQQAGQTAPKRPRRKRT
jgi:hypothetical protein